MDKAYFHWHSNYEKDSGQGHDLRLLGLPLLLVILLFAGQHAYAQEVGKSSSRGDDVGLNMEISAEKKLSKKFSLSAEGDLRLKDDISSFDRFTFGVGVDYKIISWLKVSAGGIFMLTANDGKEKYRENGTLRWEREGKTTPRYRVFAALTGSYSFARFKFSLRERYQFTCRTRYTTTRNYYSSSGEYNYSEDDVRRSKSFNILRSRLQISYDIRHCPLSPYASVEIYNSLNDGFKTKKLRYSVGLDWRVDKHNSLSISWLYQDIKGEDDDNDANSHIIGIGYAYKF